MSKKSKIIISILVSSLLIIYLGKENNTIMFLFALVSGILAIVFSIFISQDLKKLNNSVSFKVLTVLLVNIVLYVILWFFFLMCYYWIYYSVTGHTQNDAGITGMLLVFVYVFFGVLSFILGARELFIKK